MRSAIKIRFSKKARVLFEVFFFIMFIVLFTTTIFKGFSVADKTKFIGSAPNDVMDGINEGEKYLYLIDEIAREAMLVSIDEFSKDISSEECGKVGDYPLLYKKTNDKIIDCRIDEEKYFFELLQKNFVDMAAKADIESAYSFSINSFENFTLFSGKSNNQKTFVFKNGAYTVVPQFEIYSENFIGQFEKIDSFVEEITKCNKDKECILTAAKSNSDKSLVFEVGQCSGGCSSSDSCRIERLQKFCVSAGEFYFYDYAQKNTFKRQLTYKFALDLDAYSASKTNENKIN